MPLRIDHTAGSIGPARAVAVQLPGDIPVPGDDDGDGRTSIARAASRLGWLDLLQGGPAATGTSAATLPLPLPDAVYRPPA